VERKEGTQYNFKHSEHADHRIYFVDSFFVQQWFPLRFLIETAVEVPHRTSANGRVLRLFRINHSARSACHHVLRPLHFWNRCLRDELGRDALHIKSWNVLLSGRRQRPPSTLLRPGGLLHHYFQRDRGDSHKVNQRLGQIDLRRHQDCGRLDRWDSGNHFGRSESAPIQVGTRQRRSHRIPTAGIRCAYLREPYLQPDCSNRVSHARYPRE
jgi:hypothetical protein